MKCDFGTDNLDKDIYRMTYTFLKRIESSLRSEIKHQTVDLTWRACVLIADLKDDSISSNDDEEPHGLRPNSCQDSDELGAAPSSFRHFQEGRFIDGDRANATQTASAMNTSLSSKPRIWSLADMANKEDKDSKRGPPTGGKFYPSIERQPMYNHQLPYPISIKPSDRPGFEGIYPHMNYPGKLYGSAPKEYSLIESYHRALAAHNNMQSDGPVFAHSPNPANNKVDRTIDRGGGGGGASNSGYISGSKDSQSPTNVNIDANRIDIDLTKREINTQ